ncbi:MAG TPA: protein-export chaperone SecB [Steroidobacteraceae bacterium]|nr:protein-export chaperone SecB [Steroidobacteraceae bacterium]
MAEEAANTNGQADPNAPQFAPQTVYLKDVSFESPAGPRVPANANTAPTIGLNMNTSVNELGGDLKEVVLSVRVEAQMGDKTMWLVELQQAGAFGIRNVPPQELQRLLGIFCPTYLLPFARQTISDLLTKGGFPQFLLPPVNFEALFNQALARAQQEQLQQGGAQSATPAN